MASQGSSRTRHTATHEVRCPLSWTSRRSYAPPAAQLEFVILDQDQASADYAAQYVLYQQGQGLHQPAKAHRPQGD